MRWRHCVAVPVRRLLAFLRERARQCQMCKACGRAQSEIGFTVSDVTWTAVVPARWQRWAVCLDCFDRFASERGLHTVRVFLVNGP